VQYLTPGVCGGGRSPIQPMQRWPARICIRAGDRPLLGVRQAWASIRRMTWSSIFGFMFFSFLGYWLSIVVAGMGPRTPLALDPSFPPRDADFPRR